MLLSASLTHLKRLSVRVRAQSDPKVSGQLQTEQEPFGRFSLMVHMLNKLQSHCQTFPGRHSVLSNLSSRIMVLEMLDVVRHVERHHVSKQSDFIYLKHFGSFQINGHLKRKENKKISNISSDLTT